MATERDLKFGMPWDGAGEGQGTYPFRILVLSELMAREPTSGESPLATRRVRVDRDNFDEVMAGFELEPRLPVPDPESGPGHQKLLTVPLPSLAAFAPGALARVLPEAADLMTVRDLVTDLREGKLDAEAFAAALSRATVDPELRDRIREALAGRATSSSKEISAPSAPPPSKARESEDALGDLMDMVDVEASAEAAAMAITPLTPSASTGRSALDEVVSLIARSVGQGKPVDRAAVGTVLTELDRGVADHVTQALHHPELQRLEAAWRGLKLIVDRTDFRSGVSLEILSVPRGRAAEALTHVVKGELSGAVDVPVGLIVLDRAFGNAAPEIELLTGMAEAAEGLQAPMVVSIAPGFFGKKSAVELSGMDLLEYLDGPAVIKWNSLRKKEAARWVGAGFSGPLLRMPYRPGGARVKGIDYEEPEGHLLYGSPAMALAALISRCVSKNRFAGTLAQPRGDGALEDLPVWPASGGSSVEVILDDGRRHDLNRAGIICFAGQEGIDAAVLSAAPSVRMAGKLSDPDETELEKVRTNLPYQLFVSRVAAVLNDTRDRVAPDAGGDEVAMTYRAALEGLFGKDAEVSIRGREITVNPSRKVAGGKAPLSFGV
jgi:type VI secretion system protein ImpC